MHINEFSESVAKDVAARRAVMAAELPRLSAKLNEVPAATRPAVQLADAVRISAEARAAHLGVARPGFPLAPFPSPTALAAAFRAVLDADGPPATAKAVERLASLVRQLSDVLPPVNNPTSRASLAVFREGQPAAVAALVRELLGSGSSAVPASRSAVTAALVRQLFAELAATGATPVPAATTPSQFERATAALLLAIREANNGVPPQAQAAVPLPGELPAALLAHLVPRPLAAKTRRALRRKRDEEEPEASEELPGETYLSSPLRK